MCLICAHTRSKGRKIDDLGLFSEKLNHKFSYGRKMLIRSALKSTDPGASNGGANFEIRPLGADLVSFEVARLSELENEPKCF